MKEVVIILVVFSLAGFSILYVKKPAYSALSMERDSPLWLKVLVALLIYQVLLLFYGTVLGQFRFFWEKEKRLGRLLIRPFRRKARRRRPSAP